MEDGKTISASQFLEHFMFPPDTQYKMISKLSGGELRRLHLLTVLIRNPNFLILDEPTNDLDLFALNRLEEFLLNFKGCLVIVSHDRYFLDKLTDHLFIFLGDGKIRDHYGAYSTYRQEQDGSQEPVKRKKENSTTEGTKAKVKTKLSYKEQQEYDSLEPEIEALEQEKTYLEEELNAGDLDYASLDTKSKRVAEIMDLIDSKMQRWMELGQYMQL
jgi:ATP-binding cassette subfamily F protein uup